MLRGLNINDKNSHYKPSPAKPLPLTVSFPTTDPSTSHRHVPFPTSQYLNILSTLTNKNILNEETFHLKTELR